jgi:hypothetical protein
MSLITWNYDFTYPHTVESINNNLENSLFEIFNKPEYIRINDGNLNNLLKEIDNIIFNLLADPNNKIIIETIDNNSIIQNYFNHIIMNINIDKINDLNYHTVILYYRLIDLYYNYSITKPTITIPTINRKQDLQHIIHNYADGFYYTDVVDIFMQTETMQTFINKGDVSIDKFDIVNIARPTIIQNFFNNLLNHQNYNKTITLIEELKKSNLLKFLFVNYLISISYDFTRYGKDNNPENIFDYSKMTPDNKNILENHFKLFINTSFYNGTNKITINLPFLNNLNNPINLIKKNIDDMDITVSPFSDQIKDKGLNYLLGLIIESYFDYIFVKLKFNKDKRDVYLDVYGRMLKESFISRLCNIILYFKSETYQHGNQTNPRSDPNHISQSERRKKIGHLTELKNILKSSTIGSNTKISDATHVLWESGFNSKDVCRRDDFTRIRTSAATLDPISKDHYDELFNEDILSKMELLVI